MTRPKRLITIAHSYVVALNRRLGQEMAKVGQPDWDVHVVAPSFIHGDLRPIPFEQSPDDPKNISIIKTYCSKSTHVMAYGLALKQILAQGWDIVHAWEEPYILAGGQIAFWTPKSARLVYSSFQNIPKRYPPPFSCIERYAMRRAAGWVAFSHSVQAALRNRYAYSGKPSSVITVGVDTDMFRPDSASRVRIRSELGWGIDGPPVLGFLGRFVEEKGLRLLMQVLDKLPTAWRSLFVGGGPLEPHLRDWSARFPDRVRIVTGVPHNRVPAYLNAMDLLVAPSQTTPRWKEQFGRMIIEAFAVGVPVIGSDSGEIPYVIRDSGLVVAERDTEGWIRALAGMVNSPLMRQHFRAIGIQRAQDEFSWPVVARKHLQFFGEIMDQKGV